MNKLVLSLLLLCSCATVKQAESSIKADLSACKPEEQELAHELFPLVADYAVCLAFNKGDDSQCQAQEQSLVKAGHDAAIACDLALIGRADAQAHADAGTGD